MSESNLSSRLHVLVLFVTEEYRRYKQLESMSGIQADTWKSWFHGRQRPTSEMIEAICQKWPEYSFWLVNGFSDSEYGHIAPGDNGYPDRSFEQPNSVKYFAAVRKSYVAAQKLEMKFLRDELGDDIDLGGCMSDPITRSVLGLGYSDEVTRELRELIQERMKAAKLRRAEILLNIEMPKITYEQTEALGKIVEDILKSVPEADRISLEAKLLKALEQLKLHEKWEKDHAKTTGK
jgi:phage terminase Nu1 subunit (DNA packaging protein)